MDYNDFINLNLNLIFEYIEILANEYAKCNDIGEDLH
jgi:hypothetical protein